MAQAPMPPQGGQAPAQAGAQAQGGQPSQGGGGQAVQTIQMMMKGYQTLAPLVSQQGALPPEDVQLFQQASKSFEAFVQAISQPHQPPQQAPQAPKPGPGGPMAQNASKSSTPAQY